MDWTPRVLLILDFDGLLYYVEAYNIMLAFSNLKSESW